MTLYERSLTSMENSLYKLIDKAVKGVVVVTIEPDKQNNETLTVDITLDDYDRWIHAYKDFAILKNMMSPRKIADMVIFDYQQAILTTFFVNPEGKLHTVEYSLYRNRRERNG